MSRFILLTLFLANMLYAVDFTVEDSNLNVNIYTSKLSISINKNPWRLSVYENNGFLLTQEGEFRTGGNPPAPPATPLAYYLDKKTFAPLCYRVNRKKRIKALGVEIAPGNTFFAKTLISWRQQQDGVLIKCLTSEINNPKIVSMQVKISWKAENIFHLKAVLSRSEEVWNFSECFRSFSQEHYFGLGEHFDYANSRGFVRGMQPEYSPQSKSVHNKVHVLVPFYLSSRHYGVFAPIRRRGYFDMAASFNDLARFTFDSDSIEFYFVANRDPKKTIEAYLKMTGMPALYPRWVFAPHQWRNVLKNDKEVYDDIKQMRSNDIPGSVIWIDNPWQTDYNNFKINPGQFPDPSKLFKDMRAKGYKIALWSSEFVNVGTPEYKNALDKEFVLYADKEKSWPFVMPWANGTGVPVDFHQPGARAWWQTKIKSCMDLGVSGWKLDYGEIEDGITAFKNPLFEGDPRFYSKGKKIVDVGSYRLGYHQAFNELIQKKYGGDGFLICRTGTFGDQVNAPAIWPGDLDNDFGFHKDGNVGGLPAAISGGISVSTSGFPYYGPDIGGFRKGTPTKESLIRWAQFGALTPIMQLGGGGNHRPWDKKVFDQETLDIYRKYARLHTDLFPYLYTYVNLAHKKGTPIMKSLFLDYPEDVRARESHFEYLFGDAFLVAPIYQKARERKVYFPKGEWIDYWNGKLYNGPAEVTIAAPLDTLPLFVKNGSIVPMADPTIDTLAPATDPTVVTWEQKKDQLLVHVYPKESSSFRLYDGTELTYQQARGNLQLIAKNSQQARSYTWIVHSRSKAIAKKVLLGKALLKQCSSLDELKKSLQGWFQKEEGTLYVKTSLSKTPATVGIEF